MPISESLIIPFTIGEEESIGEFSALEAPSKFVQKISENFNIRNYHGYESKEFSEILNNQNHVDIRTFTSFSNEKWTVGSFAYKSAVGNFPVLELKPTKAETISTSSFANRAIDLDSEFTGEDYIIVSLPKATTKITKASSFLELSSNPEGLFQASETTAVPFTESSGTLSELRFKRSLFHNSNFNLKSVTAVRFIVAVSGATTVYIGGLRLVSKNWLNAPIDYDNWNYLWRKTIPSDYEKFEKNELIKAFPAQPKIWRSIASTEESSEKGPKPINVDAVITFNTGELKAGINNSVSFFARGTEIKQFIIQSDLEAYTQEEIEAKFPGQPEFIEGTGEENWVQFQIVWGESSKLIINSSSESGYVIPIPTLGPIATTLQKETPYAAILALQNGVASVKIYEIKSKGKELYLSSVVFDSTEITDPNVFFRIRGRIGWTASLEDPTSYVAAIQTKSLAFAEYQSVPFSSFTPVLGAKLYGGFSGPERKSVELTATARFLTEGGRLYRDSNRTTSGESYRVEVLTLGAGLKYIARSNEFEIANIENTEINFDIWYPPNLKEIEFFLSSKEKAFLISAEPPIYKFKLSLPTIEREQWQKIKIPLSELIVQVGGFYFEFALTNNEIGTFWIDKIEVYEKSFQPSGRSVVDDPWKSNYAPWTRFDEQVNSIGGALFNPKGKNLQLQIKALDENATITSPPKIEPIYGRLGKFSWQEKTENINEIKPAPGPVECDFTWWKDEAPFGTVAPGPIKSFTIDGVTHNVQCTFVLEKILFIQKVLCPEGVTIVGYYWRFGDGATALGAEAVHEYKVVDPYTTVSLDVVDSRGLEWSCAKNINLVTNESAKIAVGLPAVSK